MANYTKRYNIPTNPAQVKPAQANDYIAKLGVDLDGMISAFNATDTDVTEIETAYEVLFIPIPLTALREVSTMAVPNTAGNGGLLASDTTPILAPINGATDGCQNVVWAASNSDPIMFQVPLPPDFSNAAALVIHMRIKSAGTTNAVGFTSKVWFNEGDTAVADTGETNQTATWEEKIITVAAADIPAGAQTMTCELTPAAHTTDIMYMSALWIEAARAVTHA